MLVVFVVAGAAYVKRANLTPFIPPNTGAFGHFGWSGVLRGAGVMFFAYIGFDAVSTAAQEAKNPQRDMPIGILVSLALCTVLYIAVAIVLTGIVHYSKLNVADPLAVGIDATGLTWLSPVIKVSALFGLFSTMLVQLLGQTRIFFSMARDGLAAARVRARAPALPHAAREHDRSRAPSCALVAGLHADRGARPAREHRDAARVRARVHRRRDPAKDGTAQPASVPHTRCAMGARSLGAIVCLAQMLGLPGETWVRLFIWLVIGLVIYFLYGHSHARAARLASDAQAATLHLPQDLAEHPSHG